MSDANYASLGVTPEEEWGITPADPTLTALRITSETLTHEKETIESQEVRSDRQVSDLVQVGVRASGGYAFELSMGSHDRLLKSALFADLTTINVAAVTATIVAGATQTMTGAAAAFTSVPIGSSVKVSGSTTAANNGVKLVVNRNGDGSVLTFAPGSFTAGDVAATLTLTGQHYRNGRTRYSDTAERRIITTDGEHYFQPYLGLVADTLTLRFASKAIVTGEVGFVGRLGAESSTTSLMATANGTAAVSTLTFSGNLTADDEITIGETVYSVVASPAVPYEVDLGATAEDTIDNLVDAINGDLVGTDAHPSVTAVKGSATTLVITATEAGTDGNSIGTLVELDSATASWTGAVMAGGVARADYAAAPTKEVLNATNNIGTFLFQNAAAHECMKTLTLNIGNGLRDKDCMGELGNFDVGVGSFSLTGDLSAYFKDNTLYEYFRTHANVALSWRLTDSEGTVMVFTIPRMKLGTGNNPITGRNTDIMFSSNFTAILDPVSGATFMIDIHPAA